VLCFDDTNKLSDIIQHRLEQGEFKLRVRALDVERMMERSKIVQKNIFHSIVSFAFFNTGILLSTVGKSSLSAPWIPTTWTLRLFFGTAAWVGAKVPMGLRELNKLDEYNKRFGIKK
jgi:hypothetical protein